MSSTPRILSLAQAADELGVAPARVRALLASGALEPVPGHLNSVAATAVEALVRRNVVRSIDIAAVEGALDRALRRRLPDLLDEHLETALSPVADEVATAFADVELSTQRVTEADDRAKAAEDRAKAAEQALAAARERVVALEAQLAALRERRVGLFRRHRQTGVATV